MKASLLYRQGAVDIIVNHPMKATSAFIPGISHVTKQNSILLGNGSHRARGREEIQSIVGADIMSEGPLAIPRIIKEKQN